MKYGEIIQGDCKLCGYFDFSFMGEIKERYMVDSIKKKYVKARCLGCGWVQCIEVN